MYIHNTKKTSKKNAIKIALHLEKEQGGDGNGIGWWNEHPFVIKGVKKSVEELIDIAYESTQRFIFHTRIATSGNVCDEYTHPFHFGDAITCHNGHWSNFEEKKFVLLSKYNPKMIAPLNDSGTIAAFIGALGFDIVKMIGNGTILSLFKNGELMAFAGGELQAALVNGSLVLASSFPRYIKDTIRFSRCAIIKVTGNTAKIDEGYAYKPTRRNSYAK